MPSCWKTRTTESAVFTQPAWTGRLARPVFFCLPAGNVATDGKRRAGESGTRRPDSGDGIPSMVFFPAPRCGRSRSPTRPGADDVPDTTDNAAIGMPARVVVHPSDLVEASSGDREDGREGGFFCADPRNRACAPPQIGPSSGKIFRCRLALRRRLRDASAGTANHDPDSAARERMSKKRSFLRVFFLAASIRALSTGSVTGISRAPSPPSRRVGGGGGRKKIRRGVDTSKNRD